MTKPKHKQETRLQQLILSAKELSIQVRSEKLLREAGYRAHSGHCRVRGQELILLDRDTPIGDQIEFLAGELIVRRKAGDGTVESEPSTAATKVMADLLG